MKNYIANIPFLKPWYFYLITVFLKLKNDKFTAGYNLRINKTKLGYSVSIGDNSSLTRCKIGSFTYISKNCSLRDVFIGKFCAIAPDFKAGLGFHPISFVSIHPSFYSNEKQVSHSFTSKKLITDHKPIIIGNDVWIGSGVTVLDGIKIGDGAVIAAGAVVNRDINDYEVVGGVPAKHIKYRFNEEEIKKLKKIKWWNWDLNKLKQKANLFLNIKEFLHDSL